MEAREIDILKKRKDVDNIKFIASILNLLKLGHIQHDTYSYFLCERYLLHYKKPFNYLIDFINSYKVDDIFDINDSEYYNFMNDSANKKIDNYLNSLCRCGYISRVSRKEKKYLILNIIPENLNTTKITNKESVKKIQRVHKLNKIL
jgi:hypothetical protein